MWRLSLKKAPTFPKDVGAIKSLSIIDMEMSRYDTIRLGTWKEYRRKGSDRKRVYTTRKGTDLIRNCYEWSKVEKEKEKTWLETKLNEMNGNYEEISR